ncbi:MAG: GIY-YIG nuclease family protein [Hyphomicrobiaceae bacterium]|nr:GIY-YIG nuclease family protein [Hyphomicrobiaceae bacterium]
MRVFGMIQSLVPELQPQKTKIHLATERGAPFRLDVFASGGFPEWQRYQTQRNFERPFVLSLLKLPERERWLFGGVHMVDGPCERRRSPENDEEYFHYPLNEHEGATELTGRLVAAFRRPGRQSYLNAETWIDQIHLAEVYPKRLSIGDFPGYRSVELTFDELRLLAKQGTDSWRSSLSSVGGVYLISDTESGHLYVGSASGAGGIWQRWSDYAATGHGGNVELRTVINGSGLERARAFRFSILEIADIHTGDADVIARECHWKRALLSRSHGLNGN